jgi:hypothetical protein
VEPAGRGAEAQGMHRPPAPVVLSSFSVSVVLFLSSCHFRLSVLVGFVKGQGVSTLLADSVASEIAKGSGACLDTWRAPVTFSNEHSTRLPILDTRTMLQSIRLCGLFFTVPDKEAEGTQVESASGFRVLNARYLRRV